MEPDTLTFEKLLKAKEALDNYEPDCPVCNDCGFNADTWLIEWDTHKILCRECLRIGLLNGTYKTYDIPDTYF